MLRCKKKNLLRTSPFSQRHMLTLALLATGMLPSQPALWAQERPTVVSTPGTTLAELPGRQIDLSFARMGATGGINLRGTEGQTTLDFSLRGDEVVESADLRLDYTFSPALLADLSHLKVYLNDELVQTLVLPKENLGKPQHIRIPIDPRFFADYNKLRLQFIGHYTMECELPSHSSLWANLSDESRLTLQLRQLQLPNDLAHLPLPLFDQRDNRKLQAQFVYAAGADATTLKAAGIVAAWLGKQAGYRGTSFTAQIDQLPAGHGIVFATNAQRPPALRHLPAVNVPTLQLVDHLGVPSAKLLLVLGKDSAQLETAAQALAVCHAAFSGDTVTVKTLELPALRKPYDAPNWIATDRPVRIAELARDPGQLQLRGYALNDAVNLSLQLPPDLFTWNGSTIPVDLRYRYTPNQVSQHGMVSVLFNEQFVHSWPLERATSKTSPSAILSQVSGWSGDALVQRHFQLPAELLRNQNSFHVGVQIPAPDMGRCTSITQQEMRAAIDPDSTLNVSKLHHYIAMPDLQAFARGGFPFSKFADLQETAVLIPDQPTPEAISTYLTAIGQLSAATGYPGTRFTLLPYSQADKAGDRDLLLVADGAANPLLDHWHKALPALVEAGAQSLRPTERVLDTIADLMRLDTNTWRPQHGGEATLQGSGPLAAVAGFESPLQSGRSVVALMANQPQALELVRDGLSAVDTLQRMRGDLTLLRGSAAESFRVQDVYYVGQLPWWTALWYRLHAHPVLLAVLGIVTGLLFTFMVYASLRLLARRRLEQADA